MQYCLCHYEAFLVNPLWISTSMLLPLYAASSSTFLLHELNVRTMETLVLDKQLSLGCPYGL